AVAAAIDRTSLAAMSNLMPTDSLLPTGVRGGGGPRVISPPPPSRRRALAREITVRMAVQAGDDRGLSIVDVVHAALAPLGINVQPAIVADVGAAVRDPRTGIQIAVISTTLDYPDPASFLTQMLGHDVPARWLPPKTRAAVER